MFLPPTGPFHIPSIAVLVWCIIAPAGAWAADEVRPCRSKADLTRFAQSLPRTGRRLAAGQPLTIVAVGSSSTAGAGASSPAASYPSRLAVALRERFQGHAITVLNRGVNGEDIRDMLARFDRNVVAEEPDLVLWQLGTNSVLRDHPVAGVGGLLRQGLARLKAIGADVVLIDPQFAPRVLAKPETEDMVKLISAEAKKASVDVFPRFAVMREWRETDNIPFDAFISADGLHMNDWSYSCVAKLLGASIADAATRGMSVAGTTPGRKPTAP
jgi:lysophospholipase L1-like esterase